MFSGTKLRGKESTQCQARLPQGKTIPISVLEAWRQKPEGCWVTLSCEPIYSSLVLVHSWLSHSLSVAAVAASSPAIEWFSHIYFTSSAHLIVFFCDAIELWVKPFHLWLIMCCQSWSPFRSWSFTMTRLHKMGIDIPKAWAFVFPKCCLFQNFCLQSRFSKSLVQIDFYQIIFSDSFFTNFVLQMGFGMPKPIWHKSTHMARCQIMRIIS